MKTFEEAKTELDKLRAPFTKFTILEMMHFGGEIDLQTYFALDGYLTQGGGKDICTSDEFR